MAHDDHPEIVIVRRHGGHEDSHHGGAWKIAFADFMTAMMALFLVLWLISASNDKTKVSIARYFNPVKLVDMSTMKKGFNDPKPTDAVSGKEGKSKAPPSPNADASGPQAEKGGGKPDAKAGTPAAPVATHSESALFRDPYAVLAEIAGAAEHEKAPEHSKTPLANIRAPAVDDAPEAFQDPFATITRPPERPAPKADLALATTAPPVAAEKPAPRPSSPKPRADKGQAKAEPPPHPGGDAQAAEARSLAAEIAKSVPSNAAGNPAPTIEVKSTEEGILVSLTDDANFSMFAVGSAEPQARTIEAMAKIARLLKTRPGKIIIRGHTDGRPFRSVNYDNWRLSSARAHMAQYMLIRGGLDERRIEKIEGAADRELKNPKNPLAAENRRIEILLKKDKP